MNYVYLLCQLVISSKVGCNFMNFLSKLLGFLSTHFHFHDLFPHSHTLNLLLVSSRCDDNEIVWLEWQKIEAWDKEFRVFFFSQFIVLAILTVEHIFLAKEELSNQFVLHFHFSETSDPPYAWEHIDFKQISTHSILGETGKDCFVFFF